VIVLTRALIATQVAMLCLLLACSHTDESDEKGIVEKTTDKIAQEAIGAIRDPIDKAKAIGKIADDHAREIKEANKEEELH